MASIGIDYGSANGLAAYWPAEKTDLQAAAGSGPTSHAKLYFSENVGLAALI